MDVIGGIVAFFKSLPELIKLLNRLGDVLDRFMKWTQANNLEQWINNLERSMDDLSVAKTPEEKLLAAKKLLESIKNI